MAFQRRKRSKQLAQTVAFGEAVEGEDVHPVGSVDRICEHFDAAGPAGKYSEVLEQLGTPGIATRSKDATRGSWPYY